MSAQQSVDTIKGELRKLKEHGCINDQLNSQFDTLISQINTNPAPALEYVEAIYAFQAQQDGDLSLQVGDKIQVLEKISSDWYKGKCGDRVGVFPSNYVKPAFDEQRGAPPVPAPPQYQQAIAPQNTSSSNATTQSYQQPPFPPPSTGYYQNQQQYYQQPQQVPPPQQQQQLQQQPQKQGNGRLSKIGGQLGNAFVFGAGATLGGDLVNSIF